MDASAGGQPNDGPGLLADDVPDKSSRPRAYQYDPRRYQWAFWKIPAVIRLRGRATPNPFRETALFTVHGIGEQALTQTAAQLRLGIEEVIEHVEPRKWHGGAPDNWIVPQPYIYDAFWANYDSVESILLSVNAKLSPREREFLERVWKHRAISIPRTLGWLNKTSFRLLILGWRDLWYYLPLLLFLYLSARLMALHPRFRAVLREYANDARLYLEPHGDIEHAIVQHIDRRVGEEFLQLLNLDWDLNRLDAQRMLRIGGTEHLFTRVLWISHSLGTVISYNVLSDLLHRCRQERLHPTGRLDAVESIEKSLSGFVTLGSPLDKIARLYGRKVLRPIPEEYLPGGALDLWKDASGKRRDFWQNYFYVTDPISGELEAFRDPGGQNLVSNHHPAGRAWLFLSHFKYQRDNRILGRLLEHAYDGLVAPPAFRSRPFWRQQAALLLVWALLLMALALALFLFVILVLAAVDLLRPAAYWIGSWSTTLLQHAGLLH